MFSVLCGLQAQQGGPCSVEETSWQNIGGIQCDRCTPGRRWAKWFLVLDVTDAVIRSKLLSVTTGSPWGWEGAHIPERIAQKDH